MTTSEIIRKLGSKGMKAKAIVARLQKINVLTKTGKPISNSYVYTVLSKSKTKKTKKGKKFSKKAYSAKKPMDNYFSTVSSLPISDSTKVKVLSEIYGF